MNLIEPKDLVAALEPAIDRIIEKAVPQLTAAIRAEISTVFNELSGKQIVLTLPELKIDPP